MTKMFYGIKAVSNHLLDNKEYVRHLCQQIFSSRMKEVLIAYKVTIKEVVLL